MRIRKFNESDETTMDFEYIKECFIELLDNVDFNSEIVDSDTQNNTYISLGFDIPLVRMGTYFNIDEMVNIGVSLIHYL